MNSHINAYILQLYLTTIMNVMFIQYPQLNKFTQSLYVHAATANSLPTTSPVGRINDETENTLPMNIGPGIGSLTERCIYDSFTTSAVVLGVLLAVIVILLVLLVVSLCVLAKKVRSDRHLQKYQ